MLVSDLIVFLYHMVFVTLPSCCMERMYSRNLLGFLLTILHQT